MHFILEHTNVLVVPVLALMFGIFPRLDKYALRDCIVGFTIYFVSVWALGTMFNAIALKTGNGFWSANYMFMFDAVAGEKLLPFTKALFDINFKIGYGTFYPVLQILIYLIFSLVCVGLYYAIRLIYLVKDKIVAKRAAKVATASTAQGCEQIDIEEVSAETAESEKNEKGDNR